MREVRRAWSEVRRELFKEEEVSALRASGEPLYATTLTSGHQREHSNCLKPMGAGHR